MIKKLITFFIVLILGLVSIATKDDSDVFIVSSKKYIIQETKLLQIELDAVFQKINLQDSIIKEKDSLLVAFRNIRYHYKKIEFIADYFAEEVFRIPIILDEKRQFTMEGFSIPTLIDIEALLSEEEINREELKNLIKKFQTQNLQFYQYILEELLTNTILFEAIKYNVIRIETLNVTDYDCEATLNSTHDIIANLQTIDTLFRILNPTCNTTTQILIQKLNSKISSAILYLKTKHYNTIDRLYFTKKYIHEICILIGKIQADTKVPYLEEVYQIKRAIQLKSDNIYDKKFINTTFYSDDKYRNITKEEIELGKKLFFDKNLSNDKSMSCATCHQPDKFFTDGLTTSITNKTGVFQRRNTPTIINAALQSNFFHDMRAKSLEQQASHVVHNVEEFNTNYDTIVSRISQDSVYQYLFKKIYQYEHAINASTINAALAAFQHSLVALNSVFDKYMRNEIPNLPPAVKNGYNLFMGKARCGICHFAPTFYGNVPPFFGEMESEVLSIPIVWDTLNYILNEDKGRFEIIKFDIFKNAFKTPTVRNVSRTAPYMHNGSFNTLDEILDFYNKGGASAFGKNLPNQTLSDKALNLTAKEKKDIISFMQALTDSSLNRIKP